MDFNALVKHHDELCETYNEADDQSILEEIAIIEMALLNHPDRPLEEDDEDGELIEALKIAINDPPVRTLTNPDAEAEGGTE